MRELTFYRRFEADILAGLKTITIRDEQESHFAVGEVLKVSRYEDNIFFCYIKVLSVTPIRLHQLTESHATQENMTLNELQDVIRAIYPGMDELFVIHFERIKS